MMLVLLRSLGGSGGGFCSTGSLRADDHVGETRASTATIQGTRVDHEHERGDDYVDEESSANFVGYLEISRI